MPEPRWVLAMGVCASSGGMFNNYAIVQGVDHVVPVDMYLPGCPPRPEMLMDAILKIHAKIMDEPLGVKRAAERAESGHRTELVPSSIKFAPQGKRHERESAVGAPVHLRDARVDEPASRPATPVPGERSGGTR
jgi:NADH-quinone oxidoreductase subunit B